MRSRFENRTCQELFEILRERLPPLTANQQRLIVQQLKEAYWWGAFDEGCDLAVASATRRRAEHAERTRRGVETRRAKSPCRAIRAEFKAAREAGKSITAKQLAKKHEVSLPTVYRALSGLLKPPKG